MIDVAAGIAPLAGGIEDPGAHEHEINRRRDAVTRAESQHNRAKVRGHYERRRRARSVD
jgi:hypothetical protein